MPTVPIQPHCLRFISCAAVTTFLLGCGNAADLSGSGGEAAHSNGTGGTDSIDGSAQIGGTAGTADSDRTGGTAGTADSGSGDSCRGVSVDTSPVGGQLLFKSGFEPDTWVVLDSTEQRVKDIRGVDQTTGFDWEGDLEAEGRKFFMNYVDGTDGHDPDVLGSSLTSDPCDASNQVLYTWQHDSEWQSGGWWSRVQAEFVNYGFSEIYYKVRFRLGSDIAVVNGTDWRIWCMLGLEVRPKEAPSEHSLSVRIGKGSGDEHLTWGVHRRTPTEGGKSINTTERVKFGVWQTLEFYAKAGEKDSGSIWLAVDGKTLIDESVRTVTGGGVWDKVQPLKIYGNIIDVVTDPDKGDKDTVKVWFDDMEIWTKPPSDTLP